MKYLSICSGIEAATVAWKPLGFQCVGMSEIAKFPRTVLKHHYPDVPMFGDFTEIKSDDVKPIEILVGGTPCQSFSVAGLRGGLDDDRGNLALEFCRLALRLRPRWIVWENVPGVLSSNQGKDFGSFLGALAECGYGFAYRVLDAQYIRVQSHALAVPQRRRRVFVVGHLGDWRRAAQVLFERESLRRNPPPRREAGKGFARATANCLASRGVAPPLRTSMYCDNASHEGGLVAEVSGCLSPGAHPGGFNGQDAYDGKLIAFSCKDSGSDASEISPTLRSMNHDGSHANGGGQVAVAFAQNQRDEVRLMNAAGALTAEPGKKQQTYVGVTIHGTDKTARVASYTDTCGSLRTKPPGTQENSSTTAIQENMKVRRLTPLECERLQGFPDGYTNVKYRGKPAADSPRYKAIGNSMAVNVMSWIGQRIKGLGDSSTGK